MGEVIPFRRAKGPSCTECGRAFPDLRTMDLSIAPSDIRDFRVRKVVLDVVCPCGTGWTLGRRTK